MTVVQLVHGVNVMSKLSVYLFFLSTAFHNRPLRSQYDSLDNCVCIYHYARYDNERILAHVASDKMEEELYAEIPGKKH